MDGYEYGRRRDFRGMRRPSRENGAQLDFQGLAEVSMYASHEGMNHLTISFSRRRFRCPHGHALLATRLMNWKGPTAWNSCRDRFDG